MKKYKKNSFFSIHNVNLKKSVDNFCSIVKSDFLKTKIQNPTYRDFEHHFLTNFGKMNFFQKPYISEFYGFFRKKKQKNTNIESSYTLYFQHFFEKENRKMIFFLLCWYLYIWGFRLHLNTKKQRNKFFESLKSFTCSRFHQHMFAANDNMSNELLKNDT